MIKINKVKEYLKEKLITSISEDEYSIDDYLIINNLLSVDITSVDSDQQLVQILVEKLLTVSDEYNIKFDLYQSNNEKNKWKSLINNTAWYIERKNNNNGNHDGYILKDVFIKKTISNENPNDIEMILLKISDSQQYLIEMTNQKKYAMHYLVLMMQLEKIIKSYEQIKETKLLELKKIESENRSNEAEKKVEQSQKSMKRKIYELHNLVEASNEIYSILDFKQLINSALLTIIGQIGFQQAFMLMYDEENHIFNKKFQKGFGKTKLDGIEFEASSPLVSFFLKHRTPVYLDRLAQNEELIDYVEKLKEFRIFIVAPLVYNERLQGIACVGEQLLFRNFTETDFEIFHILINIISISIGNANLFQETKKLSLTDGMTNLHNYRYFEDRLNEEINRARRHSKKVSLMILDIDHFKNYNDTLGHQAGDNVLRTLGKLLKIIIRDEDIVARYGGEEFCIILPGIQKVGIAALGERVRSKIEEEPFYKEEIQPGGKVTVSLGIATFPDDAKDFYELVKKADKALYQAKNLGRNQTVVYQEIQ